MNRTPEYNTWCGMKARCCNPSSSGFARYGGRGIKICGSWMNFANFFADMGPRPEGYSIDRIDNDGNYEPGNCRWADLRTQLRNKSNNRTLTVQGKTKIVADWARETGISPATLASRIRTGWSIEEALGQTPRAVRSRSVWPEACRKPRPIRPEISRQLRRQRFRKPEEAFPGLSCILASCEVRRFNPLVLVRLKAISAGSWGSDEFDVLCCTADDLLHTPTAQRLLEIRANYLEREAAQARAKADQKREVA